MNHDYEHCLDFTKKCPKKCDRAELERDLKANWVDYIGMPVSYMSFKGSGMCPIDKKGADDDCTDT